MGLCGSYSVSLAMFCARWFPFADYPIKNRVSLEILTVLIAGPMAFYILKLLAANDAARHYWIVVLSTMELYGG